MPLLANMERRRAAHPRIAPARAPLARARGGRVASSARAWTRHERGLRQRAREGLWPSEGSVSDAALRIAAEEGVEWAASDEEVLAATLNSGGRPSPRDLYRPWRAADGRLALVFRDHRLSDLIGFVYRDWTPQTPLMISHRPAIKKAADRVPRAQVRRW
jgi:hypothetical protein